MRHALLLRALIGPLVLCGGPAVAQPYPTKPVRLVVGFAPGGATDVVARIVAQRLGEAWNHSVVVENRPGASGMIGAELVARSAPDGHTLLVSPQTSMAVAPNIFQKITYDPVRDFASVTIAGSAPMLVVVHPSLPARTFRELLAVIRARPGQITFGSGGVGTGPHMAGELLNTQLKLGMTHVPYKGESPAIVDVAGGQIPLVLGTLPAVLPLVNGKRLRGLAVTTAQRTTLAPQFPTIAEAGVEGFDASVWLGLFAPAAVSREIVNRLHADLSRLLTTADAREKLAQQGVEFVGNTPEQFSAFLKAELAKWSRVVREAGIRPD